MELQSVGFWAMLVVAVPVFWILPARVRYGFLGLLSVGYLASLGPEPAKSVGLLSAFLLLFYWLAPQARPEAPRRRRFVTGLILVVLGVLSLVKYFPPLVAGLFDEFETGLIVPLGISYYSFKLIHYIVEVALGNIRDRSLQQFFCYLFLFPIFTAGPIQRFDHFLANQEARWNVDSFCEGLTRIAHGLIKKFVLAGFLWSKLHEGRTTPETIQGVLETLSPFTVWAYALAMYVYIYFDFSAYSDLAIGMSRLFGIRIMENFHFPMVADNIREYWRRWHMTLSGWCQSYIYMPVLGLYRKPLLSLYATFFVMGMWHSGTWTRVFWGLYHATGVALYTWWSRKQKKHRWQPLPARLQRPVGIGLTQLFVAGSMTFLINEGDTYGSLRILAKLLFIDLPLEADA